jgi:hypothetical protein
MLTDGSEWRAPWNFCTLPPSDAGASNKEQASVVELSTKGPLRKSAEVKDLAITGRRKGVEAAKQMDLVVIDQSKLSTELRVVRKSDFGLNAQCSVDIFGRSGLLSIHINP